MSDWVSIEEARELGGLRLVLLQGRPSPWGVAARAILELKQIPFVKVSRSEKDPPDALLEGTRQDSFPAAMYESERPRTGWVEILLLAERLAPEPKLIPDDTRDRALMFGLANELCGEMGLAWCRRLAGLGPAIKAASTDPAVAGFVQKYASGPDDVKSATQRVIDVLELLTDQLRRQRDSGSEFLVGKTLSAADIYWATFCNLVSPLSNDKMPMSDEMRKIFTARDPQVLAALDPILLEHRDAIYERYLVVPVEL